MSMDRQIWASLPIPSFVIAPDNRIDAMNPAAEGFLNASAKHVKGSPVWDMIAVDDPLEEAFERAVKAARHFSSMTSTWVRASARR
jgi:Signal transduction histidine kinase, nitrogen specific